MQRLPTLVFDDVTSGDLNKIFLNANVQIKDDSALADGSGGPMYITVIDITNLGGTIATIADLLAAPTQWVTIGGAPEIGGVAWDTSKNKDYKIGDVVVYDNIIYWSGIENRTNNFFVPNEWNKVDRGGELYDPLSNYVIGDVVTHDDSGTGVDYVVYTRSADTVPAPSVWTAADWTRAGTVERGGITWTDLTEYQVGDVVTDTTAGFEDTYRYILAHLSDALDADATVTGSIGIPSIEPLYWRRVNTSAVETLLATLSLPAGTFVPDMHNKDVFEYTLDQAGTIDPPVNGKAGDKGTIIIRQDATGYWGCTWDACYDFMGQEPEISVDPLAVNIFEYTIMDGTTGSEDVKVDFEMSSTQILPFAAQFTLDTAGTVTLPITTTGTYHIDWGDGVVTSGTVLDPNPSHAYTSAGTYNVIMRGQASTINFAGTGQANRDLLTAIYQMGDLGWTSFAGGFTGCTNLNRFLLDNIGVSQVDSIQGIFDGCTSLSVCDISELDTSACLDMNAAFRNTKASKIDVSTWDTTACLDMGSMFENTTTSILDVATFETSGVTDMSFMFNNTNAVTLVINGFDTLSCTTFEGMFKDSKATALDLDNVSPLWDTAAATGTAFKEMFMNSRCTAYDVSNFKTAGATDLSRMFYGTVDAGTLTTADITMWDTTNVTTMESMFESSAFSQLNVSGFETTALLNTKAMFRNSKSTVNTFAGSFLCAGVTDMSYMFAGSSDADITLTGFTTTSCTTMEGMFSNAALTANPSAGFTTTSVSNMSRMFENTKFDMNSDFDTTGVTDMSYMFAGSTTNPLTCANIETDACTNMDGMFMNTTIGATAISGWPITALTTAKDFLNGSSMTTAEYDATLIAWEGQAEQSGVTIDFGDSVYTISSGNTTTIARQVLVDNNWVITDGNIETCLGFSDCTTVPPTASEINEDYYINTVAGNVEATWPDIAGTAVAIDDVLIRQAGVWSIL